jgi:hypothetical protein
MEEQLKKEDLQLFAGYIIDELRKAIGDNEQAALPTEWLKSRRIRKWLDISPASLQNLRITGQVRYRKILGSYYYNKEDLLKLFK